MSSPAPVVIDATVLAFLREACWVAEWHLIEIDRTRRAVLTEIVRLESLDWVNLREYGAAMVMLTFMEFWLGVEDLYYELWWHWCHDIVMRFDLNAEEVPEDEKKDMEDADDDDKKEGVVLVRNTVSTSRMRH